MLKTTINITIVNMNYDEALDILIRCNEQQTSTWEKEAVYYGITSTGLRKRVEKTLGDRYHNKLGKGTELHFECAYCGKPFSKMDYQLNGLGHYENRYCSRECHNAYEKKHNTVNPISDEELFYLYSKAKSLNALAKEIGISEKVLYKRLHNAGIQEAGYDIVEQYYLKPFVLRF